MPRLILYMAHSLDGFIADKDNGVGWLDPFSKEDYGYKEFMKTIGALVMGAKTFEFCQSLAAWPYPDHPSFVLTHRTFEIPLHADVRFRSGDAGEVLEEAKRAAEDKDVWLVGGADVARQFLGASLLDEAILFKIPVTLREGTSLLPAPLSVSVLRQVAQKDYPNGVQERRFVVKT